MRKLTTGALAALTGVMMSACASFGGSAEREETQGAIALSERRVMAEPGVDALPAQDLSAGECAIFIWTRARPHRFILFDGEARERAQIFHDGAVHFIDTAPVRVSAGSANRSKSAGARRPAQESNTCTTCAPASIWLLRYCVTTFVMRCKSSWLASG